MAGWLDDSWGYQRALRQQQKSDKPLLVYFYTKGCPYCSVFENKTLRDNEVSAFVGKFIRVRLDAENSIDEQRLASKFHVRGYPSVFVVRPESAPKEVEQTQDPSLFLREITRLVKFEAESESATDGAQKPPIRRQTATATPSVSKEPYVPVNISPDLRVTLDTGEVLEVQLIRDEVSWLTVMTATGQLVLKRDNIEAIESLDVELTGDR